MSNMTNHLEAALSAAVLRGGTYTGGRLYAGIFTAAPSDAGGGTEASYTGYARASFRSDVQANTDQFTVNDGSGMASNSQVVTFPTNAGTAQTATHWGIFDAASGGNLLFWGPLAIAKQIDPADAPSFPIGQFQLTWD